MSDEIEFVNLFVDSFPELRPLLVEHLADEEGELLPYLFMGEVARWLHKESDANPEHVGALLAWLETTVSNADFDIRNLIAVGLVEMLPASPEGVQVLGLLGPSLRARAETAGLL